MNSFSIIENNLVASKWTHEKQRDKRYTLKFIEPCRGAHKHQLEFIDACNLVGSACARNWAFPVSLLQIVYNCHGWAWAWSHIHLINLLHSKITLLVFVTPFESNASWHRHIIALGTQWIELCNKWLNSIVNQLVKWI